MNTLDVVNPCLGSSSSPAMLSPDIYDCIYRACQSKEDKFEESEVIVMHENAEMLRFYSTPQAENGLMFLRIQLSDSRYIHVLWEMTIPDILNCNQESMRTSMLPLLGYMFLGLFFHSSRLEDHFCAECRNSGMQEDIGVLETYKRVFNSLFNAMCSFLFSTYKGQDLLYVNRNGNGKFPKILSQAQEKVFLIMEPARVYRFMQFLAPLRPFNDERALTISYNTRIGDFFRIDSYSPLVSLEKTRGSRKLNSTQRFCLLYCRLQFRYVVNVRQSFIEVCLQVDNITCEVIPYHPKCLNAKISRGCVPNEKHFPAKICLTVGPENGYGVKAVSLGPSSPIVRVQNIGKKKTQKIMNWNFELSSANCTDAKMDWTLYDGKTTMYNKKHSIFSFCKRKTSSIDRAFSKQGRAIFSKDDFGEPNTWILRRDMEGETLKWIVEASIWVTYKTNSRYSETLRHDFREAVELKLERTPCN
ncbi:hypothetical protein SUGI_1112260 [Cryptomeria japonica]|nr:hypothetical protein SUGI_1112260 [Cryptomeria japonica]